MPSNDGIGVVDRDVVSDPDIFNDSLVLGLADEMRVVNGDDERRDSILWAPEALGMVDILLLLEGEPESFEDRVGESEAEARELDEELRLGIDDELDEAENFDEPEDDLEVDVDGDREGEALVFDDTLSLEVTCPDTV